MTQPSHKKLIAYPRILVLEQHIHKLDSWSQSLFTVENYFNPATQPKREQILIRHYAHGKVFSTFLKDYEEIVKKITKEIEDFKVAQVSHIAPK